MGNHIRKTNNQCQTRPRKSGAKKNRRRLEQRRRLVALGMNKEEVARLTSREILNLLKRPAKIGKEN